MPEFKKPSEYPALSKAQKKYDRKTKYLSLRFLEDEMDLYEFVHNQENSSQYLKNLIRNDKTFKVTKANTYASPKHDPVESSKGVVGKTGPGVSVPKR